MRLRCWPPADCSVPSISTFRLRTARCARPFWTRWFAHDGVRLSAGHLPYLRDRLETIACSERSGPVPYLPGLRAPYYVFVGRKRGTPRGG